MLVLRAYKIKQNINIHLPPQILIANNNCNTLPKVLTKKLYIYPQILVILNLLDFGSLKFKFLSGS